MPSTLDDFEVVSTIGTGSYGICKKIRRKKDSKIMVWKEIEYGSMTESEKQMLVSEVNLLRELKHQHIVQYHDRIIDRSRSIIYIIMEYCQGGDLSSMISQHKRDGNHVPEDFVWKVLIQTTLALKECHQRKNGKAVLHRDLKPANVFLDAESNVKLGDFGLARVLHHESSFAHSFVGTPYYMSPEVVNNQSYNEKSDIWALGCMVYELCALAPPFTGKNQADLSKKIRAGDFARLPYHYSAELDLLIRRMIQVEVSKRPSIDAILADPVIQRKQSCMDCLNLARAKRHDFLSNERLNGAGDIADKKYEERVKQLEMREREIESRERRVAIIEKLAEEKMKRALELLEKCGRQNSATPSPAPSPDCQSPCAGSTNMDDTQSSPPSCLSSGHKDPESPKKHVTFHNFLLEKENLRQKEDQSELLLNTYTGTYSPHERQTPSTFRHQDIQNKLFKLKDPTAALDCRTNMRDVKFTSRNLLYFR